MDASRKYYEFNKVVDRDYGIQHIYPIKQKDVAYIVDHLPSEVEKLYVFGSSLTLDCGQESDIDLLVIANKSDQLYKCFSNIFKQVDNEVDLIIKTPSEFEDNLKDHSSIASVVQRKGLLLYERTL